MGIKLLRRKGSLKSCLVLNILGCLFTVGSQFNQWTETAAWPSDVVKTSVTVKSDTLHCGRVYKR